MTILIFILVLGVLIFVHEFGHFFCAVKLGVDVEEFGFGYPPRLAGVRVWQENKLELLAKTETVGVELSEEPVNADLEIVKEKVIDTVREIDTIKKVRRYQWFWASQYKREKADDKRGIVYSINLLPLGGFVKITGESGGADDNPRSFSNQPAWKRSIVLTAGVTMNFILAWFLFAVGFYFGVPQALEQDTKGKAVTYYNVVIAEILPDSPAAKAGLQPGDEIVTVNQQEFKKSEDIISLIQSNPGQTAVFNINRQGASLDFEIKPEILKGEDKPLVGIAMIDTGIVRYGFFASIWQGLKETGAMIWLVLLAFYQLLASLITTGKVTAELAGPIGVAVLTGQVAKMGWLYLLRFTAILSVNLGVLNILPIPALDGGRLLFVIIEKIRRRKISEKVEVIVHNTGFALLMLLIIFVTFKDIGRYGGGWWQAIRNVFS